MTETIRVPPRFQGPTGFGQGGWTSCRLVQAIDAFAGGGDSRRSANERIASPRADVTVAIRAPIPLDTDLLVVPPPAEPTSSPPAAEAPWRLVDPTGAVILEATMWEQTSPDTTPVSVADAAEASARFPLPGELHPVPFCFACGLQPDSMAVHAGPLDDGRFATPWTVPDWAATKSGHVDAVAVWGALDCTAAMYAGCAGGVRRSVTAQLAVEILSPLAIGQTYALVAWDGDWQHGGWDGRKRGAASAAFDETGRCVARSTSFWIALE